MRAFIAIELPPDVRRSLGELLHELRPLGRGVKWCDPDQIHITFKFFGELPETLLTPVIGAVSAATSGTRPVGVTVSGTGTFGPGEKIRVVWAAVEDSSEALLKLHGAVQDALAPLGFPREERPFHPHLTLGRLREPSRDARLSDFLKARAGFAGGSFLADRIVLFQSTLTPKGPIYRALHSWPLEAQR